MPTQADTTPPFLISWNLTRRCNLKCEHCYLDADELDGGRGDLDTDQALLIVDRLAHYCPGAMLILTGGEPLLRQDFETIAQAASDKGMAVVVGSNGTLLTGERIQRLLDIGVQGMGVSLDAIDPQSHDRFRGVSGSWQRTMDGVAQMQRLGMPFQMQFTVTRENQADIPKLVELAHQTGAQAANVFFLVCTGRGQEMSDITPQEYEKMLGWLARAEREYADKIMVRARCAPHFLRVAAQSDPDSPMVRGATSGCIAGSGYFRITPEGDVTPCPYMPTPVGNLVNDDLAPLWEGSGLFQSLRQPVYHGKCGDCSHREICGGCRARALAATGDVMGEDPWCDYQPDSEEAEAAGRELPEGGDPVWGVEAEARLAKVPVFLRGMVKGGVERYARKKGIVQITPELMIEMRSRVGGR
ncbi:MAG: radical SAM protein [Magnetococcales bacterium]|nr:radical SAM protein [Magnetococcales bacterium]